MDRKGIIAVTLSVVLLFAWQYQNQKNFQETQRLARAQQAEDARKTAEAQKGAAAERKLATPEATNPATSGSGRTAPAPTSPPQVVTAEPQMPEKTESVTNRLADYKFTNLGGGIASIKLLNHSGDKPSDRMVLNNFGSHPIGAVLHNPEDPSDKAYTVTATNGQVVCERTGPDGVQIVKTFTLPKEDAKAYSVALDIGFSNPGTAAVDVPAWYLYAGSAEPVHATEQQMYTRFHWAHDSSNTYIDTNWFDPSSFLGYERSPGHSSYSMSPGGVTWAAVKSQYFTSVLIPEAPALGVWASRFPVKIDSREFKGIQGGIEMAGFKLAPGESVHRKFTLFAGPKEYRRLAQLGHGETALMDFGWFKIISVTLLRAMDRFHDWFGNYAWAIIVLTFVVRGALWPVQGAATKSMKKMALLQPKMTELRERYKDDPTKMNNEVMKLYKDYGVNPFAGCLPAIIQIPIFFGFYSMLGTAVELRNSHFLWVSDLSQPDTVFHLGGIPVNILPLCMAGTMIWQMALSPKSGDPAQQKMMMFLPLVFIFITYNFASALALYYTIQNILSIFQLYVTRNQTPPTLERVTVPAKRGGKGPGRR